MGDLKPTAQLPDKPVKASAGSKARYVLFLQPLSDMRCGVERKEVVILRLSFEVVVVGRSTLLHGES
jgi:hypothetical protein